ncbi:SsrA-binding protein SmpB [Pseudomaricurvus sp. HS19]|uniref:SsrA-binding protein SmpB n=1 Tax=Pseudomaricurvus sp. HS19 TaxID=2692626 RepID=UPI00136BB3E0|nr:SsrA-binding protein SmpB [Pseudomaricurvus sp. HS19]MYM64501.1 SsrA-binding protein SmpB [Pseudomaricurvus sp. HS19]
MSKKKAKKPTGTTIVLNKKARFDYELSDRYEAGIVLMGWEVKSLREGKVNIVDTHVHFKNGEAWLLNALITPLNTVSTHFVIEPNRPRKLLLHDKEIVKLQQAVEQKDYTCVVTAMYWKGHLVKCEIALAKGKKMHDKRETEKQRDWNREKQRLFQKQT